MSDEEKDAGNRPQQFGIRHGKEAKAPDDREQEEFEEQRIDDDAQVDVGEEAAMAEADEMLERLDRELVGLEPVKTRIREIADLLVIDRLRHRFGIQSSRPTLHMSFTGSPGTGKTTVAVRMAELLKGLGYLGKGHLVNVTRDDLVGQYIGHTAPKTKETMKRAMGGVLFIDEAYYLYRPDNERDYGQETIEILLQIMENNRDDIVVILAGYKDKMDIFFQSNPGMGSRIAHHIDFPDYQLDELMAIGELMLEEQEYEFSDDARKAFREYLERRMQQPRFANGRSVRNALERARLRQASRIVSDRGKVGKKDLIVIEAEDILKSRVFEGDEADLYENDNGDDEGKDASGNGAKGEKGDKGDKGDKGEKGDGAKDEAGGDEEAGDKEPAEKSG
jgi:probable Rubsico expression protein CbbX